jgi:predicted site-specific integrase-resolvase
MMTNGSQTALHILGTSAVAALLGCHRDTARKFLDTGAIKTTTIAGRRVTTVAEVRRALGVDEAGRIVAPSSLDRVPENLETAQPSFPTSST